jgi:hypothetical protein
MSFGMVPTRYTFFNEPLVLWWFHIDGWYKRVITTCVESFTHSIGRKRGRTLNVFLLYYSFLKLHGNLQAWITLDILHHQDIMDDFWDEKMHALFISHLQMNTIWVDIMNLACNVTHDFVFVRLSDQNDLYGLFDCWYDYNRVKVKTDSIRSHNLYCPRPLLQRLEVFCFIVSPIDFPLCSLIISHKVQHVALCLL